MPRKTVTTQGNKPAPKVVPSPGAALREAAAAKPRKPVTLHLPQPHPKQYELLNMFDAHPGVRFVAGACGTKFGGLAPLSLL